MFPLLLLSAVVVPAAASCGVQWPNGTDVALHWWQCDNGPIMYYNVTTWDQTGTKFMYPLHLGQPMMVKADIYDPSYTVVAPNLRATVNIWGWGGITGCVWTSLPTFGLLNDVDACAEGVTCPIVPGRQEMDIVVDFSKYQPIINILQDDKPYQLQLLLHDRQSGVNSCMMGQARAYIH